MADRRATPVRGRCWGRAIAGRYHAAVTPRLFLLLVGVLFVMVGVETWLYPADFLTLSPVWAVIALVTAGGCLHAACRPSRFVITSAGALVEAAAFGRAVANAVEVLHRGDDIPGRLVAASMWTLIGLLALVAWHHFVTPWSAARRVT